MSEKHFERRPVLTEAGAKALGEYAVELARQKAIAVAVSVVDAAGDLLFFLRMDGAPSISCDVATGKARTAIALKAPSEMFETMINDGEVAMLSVPGILPLKGGIPVVWDGHVAGAIGVSGSTGENDRLVATQTVEAFA